MPSLRELFQQHNVAATSISQFSDWVYDMLEALVEAVEPEDADARYAGCKTCDEHTIVRLAYELAEAKAEIERLKALISDLTAGITMCRADAEIGRLVRGMKDRTRLTKGHPSHALCQKQMYYWVERQSRGARSGHPLCDWRKVEHEYLKSDPAEALRSIQEEGDE